MKKGSKATEGLRADFPRLLKEAMAEAGIRGEVLAEKAGVARISIYYYRNGYRLPRRDVLKKIARAVQKPLAYFMEPGK